jgi:hypothetical protein
MKVKSQTLRKVVLLALKFIKGCIAAGFIFELPLTCYVMYIITTNQGSHLPIFYIVFFTEMHNIFFIYNRILLVLWGIVFFSSFFMYELIDDLPQRIFIYTLCILVLWIFFIIFYPTVLSISYPR